MNWAVGSLFKTRATLLPRLMVYIKQHKPRLLFLHDNDSSALACHNRCLGALFILLIGQIRLASGIQYGDQQDLDQLYEMEHESSSLAQLRPVPKLGAKRHPPCFIIESLEWSFETLVSDSSGKRLMRAVRVNTVDPDP
ncbi:hypothetical protein FPOAC1_004709 [Fusarium poae]|uniref:hypothetical protein n=1 Tax=Fusarium poae TaxID=36050 RepID=UPI001CE84DF8|nr:hypothetical protein FPOAC1_004709 [Fusarium poae]KAG8671461.1 hypothetical protein FPOAC1_004709 [Fusarium poae]